MESLTYIITMPFVFWAAIRDVQKRIIPNDITIPLFMVGLLYAIFYKPETLISAWVGILVLLLIGIIPGIGMGDIKLLMGLCFFYPPADVLSFLGVASILIAIKALMKTPHVVFFKIWYLKSDFIRLLTRREKFQKLPQKTQSNSEPFALFLLIAIPIIEGGKSFCSLL